MTSYILRNYSGKTILVKFKPFHSKFYKDGKPRISVANETVRLNSKGLAKLKINVPLKDAGDGYYSFELSPQMSAGISALFDRHNLLTDEVLLFKSGKEILKINSPSDAVEKFRHTKRGIFRSGGLIFYYDVQ